METSVVMSSTDPDGNEINRTYSGINPTATSEEITDFTEELNALSENTYVSTTRRDITHSDREAGLVAYTLPTAASDVKGGVMIGGGLSMDGDTLNCTVSAGTLSLATTDAQGLMSADDKVKLNGISAGAQVNVIESISIDGTPQTISGKSVELNLVGYVKKTDISGVYKYKGTVGSLSELPASGQNVGDVYNVSVGGGSDFQGVAIKAGDNVAWNGSGWDALAGIVDLSNFVTKDGNKVLSTNDFTDAYKSKLDTLSGYTLPTANATQKGGIKIGEGLAMNGDTAYVTIQSGETYSNATTVASGLMSASDKVKLNGIAASANYYTLPTASTSTKGGVKVGTGLSMYGDSINASIAAATTTTDGLMSASDKTKLNGIASSANYYTLPTASTSTKGGVKVGTGLSMNGETLNCTVSGSSYTLPTASSSTKGGVKVGSGLAMSGETLYCTVSSTPILTSVSSNTAGAMWIATS